VRTERDPVSETLLFPSFWNTINILYSVPECGCISYGRLVGVKIIAVVVKAHVTSWKGAGLRPDEVNEFVVYLILPDALGLGVHSVSNRNEYQKQRSNVSGEYSTAGT
jgi:hypothetical protein